MVTAVPHPYLDADYVKAFAHRGGTDIATENTIGAFRHAAALGYQYFETDVHRTSDGVLVAFHDAGLQRITGVEGTIADRTWAELKEIDLGDGEGIPTLDALLESFPAQRFNIDPKADDAVELLGDAIVAHGALDRICVGSFSDDRIATLQHRLGDGLCTSPGPRTGSRLLSAALAPTALRRRALGHSFQCVQIPRAFGPVQLNRRMVEGFHELGLEVHVWTINDRPTMEALLDLGVDGIMTDRLSTLRTLLVDRELWPD